MIKFLERDVENMIMTHTEQVQKRGFPPLLPTTIQQFRFPSGRTADILSYEITEHAFSAKVFELKKDALGLSALFQLLEYGEELANLTALEFKEVSIKLYLVGHDIDDSLFKLALWGVNVGIVTFSYKFEGVFFENSDEHLQASYLVRHPMEVIMRDMAGSAGFIRTLNHLKTLQAQRNGNQ